MEFSFCSVSCFTGIVLGILIAFKLLGPKEKKTKKVPRGVVALHVYKGGRLGVPNLSPPCLKLESYLRMTKIPYEYDFSFKMSSKGKMPWIEYNGQEIADSNFCIEFLSKEFGVDVDDHLTDEQKGIARAARVMLEENTFWTLVYWRWLGDYADEFRNFFFGSKFIFPIKYALFWWVQRKVRGYLYGHGIGRHTPEEIYGIAEKDLRAVSAILGEKKFLFGDKPCLADISLFALVSNFIFTTPVCPQGKVILTQLTNLEDHAKRIKEALYPDWEEICYRKKKTT